MKHDRSGELHLRILKKISAMKKTFEEIDEWLEARKKAGERVAMQSVVTAENLDARIALEANRLEKAGGSSKKKSR